MKKKFDKKGSEKVLSRKKEVKEDVKKMSSKTLRDKMYGDKK